MQLIFFGGSTMILAYLSSDQIILVILEHNSLEFRWGCGLLFQPEFRKENMKNTKKIPSAPSTLPNLKHI